MKKMMVEVRVQGHFHGNSTYFTCKGREFKEQMLIIWHAPRVGIELADAWVLRDQIS